MEYTWTPSRTENQPIVPPEACAALARHQTADVLSVEASMYRLYSLGKAVMADEAGRLAADGIVGLSGTPATLLIPYALMFTTPALAKDIGLTVSGGIVSAFDAGDATVDIRKASQHFLHPRAMARFSAMLTGALVKNIQEAFTDVMGVPELLPGPLRPFIEMLLRLEEDSATQAQAALDKQTSRTGAGARQKW